MRFYAGGKKMLIPILICFLVSGIVAAYMSLTPKGNPVTILEENLPENHKGYTGQTGQKPRTPEKMYNDFLLGSRGSLYGVVLGILSSECPHTVPMKLLPVIRSTGHI